MTEMSIAEILISDLSPYPDHHFKLYSEKALAELAKSIEESGLLHPIIVCENFNDTTGLTILSGHNRVEAYKMLKLEKIKAIVKRDLSKDECDLIVAESNLRQRQKLLPSEKAWAYKMRNDALKNQGRRTDLELTESEDDKKNPTSSPAETKLDSARKVGIENGESRSNIHRYISLTRLNKDLLDLVDEGVIAFRTGVILSTLKKNAQNVVYSFFFKSNVKIPLDTKTAKEICKLNEVTKDKINSLFTGDKRQPKSKKSRKRIIIPMEKFENLLDNFKNDDEKINYIIEALKAFEDNKNKESEK